MKSAWVGVLLAWVLVVCVAYAESPPSQVTIGFLPGGNAETVKRASVELAKALQDELGIPVNVYLSKNYSGLVEAMKMGKVDFAFFTAMAYVFAEKQAGAKVLLKKIWAEPFYYSTIVTKGGSRFKRVQDLQSARMGFVEEKSTSGYLYPSVLLKKRKSNPAKFGFQDRMRIRSSSWTKVRLMRWLYSLMTSKVSKMPMSNTRTSFSPKRKYEYSG